MIYFNNIFFLKKVVKMIDNCNGWLYYKLQQVVLNYLLQFLFVRKENKKGNLPYCRGKKEKGSEKI